MTENQRDTGPRHAVGEDRALTALDAALAASDADATEAFLTARSGEYTRFADTRVHHPQDIVEQQLMVRVVVDGHAARAATSRIEDITGTVHRACRAARAQAAAGLPGHAHPVAAAPEGRPDAPVRHPDTGTWDVGERSRLAGHAMDAARRAGGAAYGMFGRATTELAVATSGGVRVHTSATEAGAALTVKVDDGSSHWTDLGRSSAALDTPANITRAIGQARAARAPEELPDGVHDVVLGPLAAAEFLDFFGTFGFTGSALADGVGAVAERRGHQVASPLITVADDALAPVGLPIAFDFEGVPKRRVTFLDRGRVADAVTDLASAALLGTTSTGHAHIAREESPRAIPMNLVMSAGHTPEDALIAGVERGVYIQRFWYTRAVDTQATTITGVSRDACFLIEHGVLTRPVRGRRFTESVFGALARVDAVGDRLASKPLMNTWNGCASAPALRIRGFRFGSRPATSRDT
ncbi:TldD/PmbA family protein [Streptomyces sp. DT171]|uniref:TldD/PmbA family protein n=1 Tax=Streptomyces sp. DT171 TaxID=3416524 RepID=UPI003CF3CC72